MESVYHLCNKQQQKNGLTPYSWAKNTLRIGMTSLMLRSSDATNMAHHLLWMRELVEWQKMVLLA